MILIAHRGFANLAPENTFEAFEFAVKNGAKALELDVQLTLDGKVVCFHDHLLDRTSNGKGLLRKASWSKIKKLDAGSWFSDSFKGARIPRLEEVLDHFGKEIRLFIEIKKPDIFQVGIENKVIRSIKRAGLEKNCFLHSFHLEILKRCAALDNAIPKLLVKQKFNDLTSSPETKIRFLKSRVPSLVGFNLCKDSLSKAQVSLLKKAGMEVYSWTAFSQKDIKKMEKMGVDGVISNVLPSKT